MSKINSEDNYNESNKRYYRELNKTDPDFELLITLMKEYNIAPDTTTELKPFNCNEILHEAVKRGRIDLIDRILELGVNINAKTINYENALQLAIYLNNIEIADKLIKAGADVNADINNRGGLIIHDAIKRGNPKIIKMLLDAGANITQVNEGKTILSFIDHYLYTSIHRSEITKLIKDKLNIQLFQEIRKPNGGNPDIIIELIKFGSDMNVVKKEGRYFIT